MKNRKYVILIIIVLAVSIFTTGCMKKVNEKIGTKIGEKVLEKALGDDVKIDTKDNNVSISTKDGSFQSGSNLEWPTDKMKPLPKPKAEVVTVTDLADDNSTSVIVNFSDPKGSRDYLQKVKDLGYIENTITESDDFFSFLGFNKDNTQVMIHSQESGETTVITLTRDSVYAEEYFKNEQEEEIVLDLTDVDMTDVVPWPKDQMDKIPELVGKIISVTTSQESVYVELEYVKKEDVISFIETVKNLGFNTNTSEVTSPGNILYMSIDDKGYGISIRWYGTGAAINYSKP